VNVDSIKIAGITVISNPYCPEFVIEPRFKYFPWFFKKKNRVVYMVQDFAFTSPESMVMIKLELKKRAANHLTKTDSPSPAK